jgi:hypothetical protein
MFKILSLILLCSFIALNAQDNLQFKPEKFKKIYLNPKNGKDTLIDFSVSFPNFTETGKNKAKAKYLNSQVKTIILGKESSAESKYKNLVKDYKETYAEGEPEEMRWALEEEITVTQISSDFIGFTYSGYNYSGGAHGGSWINYSNYDLTKLKPIKLGDVLVKNYLKELTKIGEIYFRKDKGLVPDASLEGDYWFKDNKFHLNDNFNFTPKGILFFYNQYEIACYACGTTELLIPYTDIKKLINTKGLLKSFAK